MSQGMLGKAIAVLIAISVVMSVVFGFLAEAITQVLCGARPAAVNLFSGLWLAITGNPAAYTAPAGCVLPVWQIRTADLTLLLLMIGLGVWGWVAVLRYRQSDRAFIADLRTRPGFAEAGEIRNHLSGKAVLRRATQLRPDIPRP